MMKIFGIAIMMISSVLYGLSFYKKYKLRPSSLDVYINLIEKYLLELKWKRKSIYDVIKDFDNSEYFNEFKILLANNTLKDSAITLNSKYCNLYLTGEDTLILKCFFENTGKSNLESEIVLCNKTLEQLRLQKEDAEINMKKFGPLSLKFCFIIAVWIAIMFI